MIDADPQGNATSGVGLDKNTEKSIYDVIINDVEIDEAIEKTQIKIYMFVLLTSIWQELKLN